MSEGPACPGIGKQMAGVQPEQRDPVGGNLHRIEVARAAGSCLADWQLAEEVADRDDIASHPRAIFSGGDRPAIRGWWLLLLYTRR